MSKKKEAIDPFETLRNISAQLLDFDAETDPEEYLERVASAAWMIAYVAEALEHEFRYAAVRGIQAQQKALKAIKLEDLGKDPNAPGGLDTWEF